MRRPSRMHVAQAQPVPCPRRVTDGNQLQIDGMRARSRAHAWKGTSPLLPLVYCQKMCQCAQLLLRFCILHAMCTITRCTGL